MAQTVTNEVLIVVALILVIVVSATLVTFAFSESSEELKKVEKTKEEIVERIKGTIQLVREPDIRVTCTGRTASGNYLYDIEMTGAEITFIGNDGETLSVIPVLEIEDPTRSGEDKHYRDSIPAVINARAGEVEVVGFAGPTLRFTNIENDIPPPIDKHEESAYSGILLPKQRVVVNNYSVLLSSLDNRFFGLAGRCQARVWVQCDKGFDPETFYLGDDNLGCENQEDRAACDKKLLLCGNPVGVALTNYVEPNAACHDKKPHFVISVPKKDGVWDFRQFVFLSFWKAPSTTGPQDCWQSDLTILDKRCGGAWRGAYKVSIPLENINGGACL